MELQEFIAAVENLLGAKSVEVHQLERYIESERMSVRVVSKFLGGADVWLDCPFSDMIQPTHEDLADSFRRVQQAFDRTNADWPTYEECAAKALQEFKDSTKLPLDYTAVIRDFMPGYFAKAPGIDVELFYITCQSDGEAIVNNRAIKLVTRSHKATPGIHAIEVYEVDGKRFLRAGSDRKAILFGCAKCEGVEVSLREFEVLPDVLGHTTTDPERTEMPDIEIYERLTRRHEYVFVEFEVV